MFIQPQKPVSLMPTKATMVAGRETMDWAKMTGRTPDMLTLMGRNVLWPPYIFRPTMRLAYCTGMRRSELVMNTMTTTRTATPTRSSSAIYHLRVPVVRPVMRAPTWLGMREMMPANRIMEMPLPMPNWSICSPSHMTRQAPPVKVMTMTRPYRKPVSVRMPELFFSII